MGATLKLISTFLIKGNFIVALIRYFSKLFYFLLHNAIHYIHKIRHIRYITPLAITMKLFFFLGILCPSSCKIFLQYLSSLFPLDRATEYFDFSVSLIIVTLYLKYLKYLCYYALYINYIQTFSVAFSFEGEKYIFLLVFKMYFDLLIYVLIYF